MDKIISAAIPPPLPPKVRGGYSCLDNCAPNGVIDTATVFESLTINSTTTTTTSAASPVLNRNNKPDENVVKIKINLENNKQERNNPIISSVQLNSIETSCVRINVGPGKEQEVPALIDTVMDHQNSYYISNNNGNIINTFISSGQSSPSDTLDSGTCSDLDTSPAPPALPKKKSVSITLISTQQQQQLQQDKTHLLSTTNADSSDDNESNISCDSLNSADLIEHLLLNDEKLENTLPQNLLKDIRNHSTKTQHEEPPHPQPQLVISAVLTTDSQPLITTTSDNEERKVEENGKEKELKTKMSATNNIVYETDKYYKFHLNENEINDDCVVAVKKGLENDESFAGYRDILGSNTSSTIRSAKGTVRGVKNRVRAGIATFLHINSTAKNYKEKDAGKVVVYSTTMGIVRKTFHECLKVKQILRTHLVKFEERDVFMSGEYQAEIRDRMHSDLILVPQVFVDGQHIGDTETIDQLNESGELRRILKPYKSADACSTCNACGGYRLLPCSVCNGSKKSLHRNHFTTEFVALKCMNCDEVGLVRCLSCS